MVYITLLYYICDCSVTNVFNDNNIIKVMANLLNLKIKLNLNNSSLNFDSGNLTESQIREKIQALSTDMLGYLSSDQKSAIINNMDFADVVKDKDWTDVGIDEGAALVDFITGGVESNKPLNKDIYAPVDADAFTDEGEARETGDTDVERLFAGFIQEYSEELDNNTSKWFLWKKDALAAMNAACANAASLSVTLADITGIRALDPDDDSSETNMGYAYAQGLTADDLIAFFAKAGVDVMFDDSEHLLYKKDNHIYQKVGNTIVYYNSTNLVLNTDVPSATVSE